MLGPFARDMVDRENAVQASGSMQEPEPLSPVIVSSFYRNSVEIHDADNIYERFKNLYSNSLITDVGPINEMLKILNR